MINFRFNRLAALAVLDRYVLRELFFPFCFGIAVFTILFMATGPIFDMANLVIKYGVPVRVVIEYALVRLPSFIAYTLPMAVLVAMLVAFGRFSSDHETVAMKASGISFYRILAPALLFSLFAALLAYALNTKIGPESLYLAKVIVSGQATKAHLPPVNDIKFTSSVGDGVQRITIAKSFDEHYGLMLGPVISDYDKQGRLVEITHAKEARWVNHAWTLLAGEIFRFNAKGEFDARIAFASAVLRIPQTPQQVGLIERSPDEMDSPLLRKSIAVMQRDPQADPNDLREMWMRYRLRQALPLACVVFALIGAPSGIRPVRSGSATGIAMAVVIILVYYFMVAFCKSLGEEGTLSPGVSVWIPNLAFLFVGLFYLAKEST